jgi:sarcosine oxidase
MTYDAIVLGVGGMGSAALYHLARRGRRVLGLEQFSLGHDRGSSHGVNRIIRLAYAEHPNYVPLLRRAYELWRELESHAGEKLLYITGGLDIGTPDSQIVTGSLRSCREHDLPHEQLTAREIAARYPGYRLPPELVAVYQAEGGFVMSERAILAHAAAAMEHGAEVRACERVVEWSPAGSGITVRTERETYRADRLVITAGPWIGQMTPALARITVPERQVLMWTQPLRPEHFALGAFPIFNMEVAEGRFYGFPVHGVPGFKLGKYHHRHETSNPGQMNREIDAEDERVLREGIARYFPDANGPTLAMKTCIFTNTPDEHFILDLHPEFKQVVVASPCSGHGYKFASVVGEILADFAIEGGCKRWDLSLFRVTRPSRVAPGATREGRVTPA